MSDENTTAPETPADAETQTVDLAQMIERLAAQFRDRARVLVRHRELD